MDFFIFTKAKLGKHVNWTSLQKEKGWSLTNTQRDNIK